MNYQEPYWSLTSANKMQETKRKHIRKDVNHYL